MTVVPFKRPEPPRTGQDVRTFSLHIYENTTTDMMTVHIEQEDRPDGTVDMEQFIDAVDRAVWHAFHDLYDTTQDPDHRLLLQARIFWSSKVSSRWRDPTPEDDNGFETPAQLRWFRRRLDDLYWQVDPNRAGRNLHRAKNLFHAIVHWFKGLKK